MFMSLGMLFTKKINILKEKPEKSKEERKKLQSEETRNLKVSQV